VFDLSPNAQLWPRILNVALGGIAGNLYLIVSSSGVPQDDFGGFLVGMVFLERFYSVFDTANQRVGLAKTPFTYAISN
jgi:cathepsin E